MVSLVLPVFNERDNLEPLFVEIAEALVDVPHEVVAVDDASSDGSRECLMTLAARHPALRVVGLRAHAGQSAALAAGIDAAQGTVVVTLDADGQNDPSDIPALLAALRDDPSASAVIGYRAIRQDSGWRRMQSRIANGIRRAITGDGARDTGCSLKAMRTPAVRRLPRFDGMHRFFPALLEYGGGRVVEVPVNHRPRRFGRSKYGMWGRAMRGLRDAFGVRWIGRRTLRYAIDDEVSGARTA